MDVEGSEVEQARDRVAGNAWVAASLGSIVLMVFHPVAQGGELAKVVASLPEAIGDCVASFAFSARGSEWSPQVLPMREAAGPPRPAVVGSKLRAAGREMHDFAINSFRSFLGTRGAFSGLLLSRSEEHTSELPVTDVSRMPSSA